MKIKKVFAILRVSGQDLADLDYLAPEVLEKTKSILSKYIFDKNNIDLLIDLEKGTVKIRRIFNE